MKFIGKFLFLTLYLPSLVTATPWTVDSNTCTKKDGFNRQLCECTPNSVCVLSTDERTCTCSCNNGYTKEEGESIKCMRSYTCGSPLDKKLEMSMQDPGGSFSNVKANNQGNTYSCYSHAASHALTAFLHSEDPKLKSSNYQVSPLGLSLQDKWGDLDQIKNEGGGTCDIINKVASHRTQLCDRNNFIEYKGLEIDTGKLVEGLRTFLIDIDNYKTTHDFSESSQRGLELIFSKHFCQFKNMKRERLGGSFLGDFEKIAKYLLKQKISSREVILLSLLKKCSYGSDLISTPIPSCVDKSSDLNSDRGFNDRIHALLDEGSKQQPIIIGYCSNVLYGDYDGLWDSSRDMKSGCGAHGSTIIGRRCVNNRWHFVLRNTYGHEDCRDALRESTIIKKATGNCLIDAENLSQNIYSLSRLEKP